MFMLPGLEGCAAVLEPLCKRLKIKVCVLQLGVEHRSESSEQMVTRLHQVKSVVILVKEFVLILEGFLPYIFLPPSSNVSFVVFIHGGIAAVIGRG